MLVRSPGRIGWNIGKDELTFSRCLISSIIVTYDMLCTFIFDSSDLQYLYLEDNGSMNIPLGGKYYGELVYDISFHRQRSGKFNWFFADPYSVEDYAEQCGLKMEFIRAGEHYDYSAKLIIS